MGAEFSKAVCNRSEPPSRKNTTWPSTSGAFKDLFIPQEGHHNPPEHHTQATQHKQNHVLETRRPLSVWFGPPPPGKRYRDSKQDVKQTVTHIFWARHDLWKKGVKYIARIFFGSEERQIDGTSRRWHKTLHWFISIGLIKPPFTKDRQISRSHYLPKILS